MGTRHLIAVKIDGEYKVAQYGQWDGYPEGQGIDTLHFLRDKGGTSQKFQQAVRNCFFISDKELNFLYKRYGADDNGMIRLKDAERMDKDYPQFSRDTGAEILRLIQNSADGIRLHDSLSFAADSLFCEWAWVIDFDTGTFEGYDGFNQNPLNEADRFFFLDTPDGVDGYHPVRLVASWSLNALPSDDEFVAAFKGADTDSE